VEPKKNIAQASSTADAGQVIVVAIL